MKQLGSIGPGKIGIFISGGLTSSVVAKYLMESDFDIHIFWADVGQYDEPELSDVFKNFEKNHVPITKVDLRDETASMALQMIALNAVYEGGYWNSTGALRYVLVKNLAPFFYQENCSFFTHGCVGGGNDQRRFHRYGSSYMDGIQEITPWELQELAEKFHSRADMYEFLIKGFDFSSDLHYKAHRSTDSCMIGTSYEGSDIESLDCDYTEISTLMSKLPWQGADQVGTIKLTFENGRLAEVNDESMSQPDLVEYCNKIAGEHCISLKSVFENRITDTKCRGVYESPGMDLISFGFQNLLQVSLNKEDLLTYGTLSTNIAKNVYRGQFNKPDTIDWIAASEQLSGATHGDVTLKLYKGNLYCIHINNQSANGLSLVHQRRFAEGGLVWHNN